MNKDPFSVKNRSFSIFVKYSPNALKKKTKVLDIFYTKKNVLQKFLKRYG